MYAESLESLLTEALLFTLKSDKDLLDYSLITLLTCDCKFLSKILAVRLDKVITRLIHPNQVDFIHSRSSSESMRCLIDGLWAIQNGASLQDASPAAALSLGAQKGIWQGLNRNSCSLIWRLSALVQNSSPGSSYCIHPRGFGNKESYSFHTLFTFRWNPPAAFICRNPNATNSQIPRDSHQKCLCSRVMINQSIIIYIAGKTPL